jgi:hypothetical protein
VLKHPRDFQSMESGRISAVLRRHILNLKDEHSRTMLGQVEKLRTALGGPTFRALDALLENP